MQVSLVSPLQFATESMAARNAELQQLVREFSEDRLVPTQYVTVQLYLFYF